MEEWGGQLSAAEMKWSRTAKGRPPSGWRRAYPEGSFQVVHPGNYLAFIGAAE